MKRVLIALVGGCILAATPGGAIAQQAAPAQSAEAAELAEARDIIAIMFPPAQRLQTLEKMQGDLMSQMRPLLPANFMADPGLSAIMNDYIAEATVQQRVVMQKHMPLMFDAMAIAYTHEFSLAELKDIHAFARTASGTHYLSKSTAIIADPAVAKVNTAMFRDIHETTQAMLPGLKEKVVAYLKAHPDVAAKLEADTTKE